MPEDKFDAERVRDYWLIEAEEALRVADHLVASKDYSCALFACLNTPKNKWR